MTIFTLTFFNIISFHVCVSFLFCTLKKTAVSWICFKLIIILPTKMSPKTWEDGDTIFTATAEGNKKRLTHKNWRSVAVKLTLAASHLESFHISWSNYHSVLLPGRWEEINFWGDGETGQLSFEFGGRKA